jgi:hypothetical protein
VGYKVRPYPEKKKKEKNGRHKICSQYKAIETSRK